MAGLLDDLSEYGRRSGRNLSGLLEWLGGGARMGAEPVMALMRGDAIDEPLLPTTDSGGRIGAVASALGSTVMPVKAPAGALGAGPVVRSADAALDMSPEARAARAAEMGFSMRRKLYHGTGADFGAFRPSRDGESSFAGVSLTKNPAVANFYAGQWGDEGAQIMPVVIRGKTQDYMKFMDGAERYYKKYDLTEQELTEYARAKGITGVVSPENAEVRVFNPADIRSRFAAFDPARAGEADLLASRVPLSGLLAQPLTLDDLKDRL